MYQKVSIVTKIKEEQFFSNFKVLAEEGYLKVAGITQTKKDAEMEENASDAGLFSAIQKLKKGSILDVKGLSIKEEKLPHQRDIIRVLLF